MRTSRNRASGNRTHVHRNRDHRARRSPVVPGLAVLLLVACSGALHAQDDPFGANWPEGEGRALTGAWCGGCHSLNLVKQQGLTHSGWDELLVWMSEKQNMPPLKGEQRATVLDYLASNFGIDSGGGANAGANQRFDASSPVQGIRRPLLEIRPAGTPDAG